MGILNLTESERNEILSLHNNARILKEQSTPVDTTAVPQDRKSKIMKLQTILKTKYNADLGTTGPNKDGIDGDLGGKTLGALATIMKSKSAPAATTGTPPAAPAATTGTPPAAPAATTGTPPAADAEVGAEAPQQLNQASQQALGGQSTPQQIRQQSRFDQKLARQARRTERRAQ